MNSKKKTTNNWMQPKKDQTSSEKLEIYREAFAKIEAATGVKDIDQLVTNFVKAEEKNFALFKFVNEMSNDIEAIEAEIQELQQEVETGMAGPVSAVEEQRRKELKAMVEKKRQILKKTKEVELDYNKSEKQLEFVRNTIHSIFTILECD